MPMSLAPVNPDLILPFWYRLTWVVPDKRAVKWVLLLYCVCYYRHKYLMAQNIAVFFLDRFWCNITFCHDLKRLQKFSK